MPEWNRLSSVWHLTITTFGKDKSPKVSAVLCVGTNLYPIGGPLSRRARG